MLSSFTPSFDWIPSTLLTSERSEAKQLAGRLWLEHQLPLTPKQKHDFLSNGLLTTIPAMEKHWWGWACRKCGNKTQRHIVPWPCPCGNPCYYCRVCIEMGRITSCTSLWLWTGGQPVWSKVANACTWKGTLSRYQQQGAEAIVQAITEKRSQLVWAVCGAGKTEMLFPGLEHAFSLGLRVCLATPRADVVRELKPRLQAAFPHVDIVALYGGTEDVDKGALFVIATTHQLMKYADAFDVMIIDEVDAFPYHADRNLQHVAKRAQRPDSALLYLTATPRWKMKLLSSFNKLPTVFVPQRYHGFPLPVPQFMNSFDTEKAIVNGQLPFSFRKWIITKREKQRRVIVFVPTINMAEQLAPLLHEAIFVHSEDPEREQKVADFRNEKFNLLIATTILERGVTFPSIDVAVLHAGHHVFDEAALIQIAGRAGRSAQDPDGDVVFFHQGKTEAMLAAKSEIEAMNIRARKGGN